MISTEQLKAIKEILMLLTQNELMTLMLATLFTIGFAIYFVVVVWLILRKRDYYTAVFQEFVEDKLYAIEKKSVRLFLGIWNRHADKQCVDCIHPQGSFEGSLHTALFQGTMVRIMTARSKNGFYSMTEQEYIVYLKNLGARLRNKNQYDMCYHSRGLGKLIEDSNDERFTEEEGFLILREIMDEAKDLHRKELKDIIRIIFFQFKDKH